MTVELDIQELQMGLPVYSTDKEKVGTLRFAMCSPTPPYQIQQLLVDRTDGADGGMMVETLNIDSVSTSAIQLNISSDEFFELPPFVETQWFSIHPPVNRKQRGPQNQRPGSGRQQDRRPRYQQRQQPRNIIP
ncbi:MAG: hypothetical protein K6A35_02620 [bacterium]|nr:hypothetical protein [bacterium]